ncbi:MAG: carboxy terminal-processing peptidase [Chitinophagaceae bacterium]
MRRRIFFATLCLLFFFSEMRAQSSSLQSKAIIVKRMIEMNHVSPRLVDDSFSMAMFRSLVKTADRRNLLFTESEYKKMLSFSVALDDELNGKSWQFFDVFESLYKKALIRADSIVNQLLKKPFDFSINESVTRSGEESFNFAENIPALMSRWSRYLKYRALDNLYDISKNDSSGKSTLKSVAGTSELKVRERILANEIKSLKKILNNPAGFSEYVFQLYLDAISTGFDPHTNYFSQQGKDEFKAALSTEAISFGFALEENDEGQIIIDQLTPGGPAWKSGDLHEGDELVSLQWEGKEVVEMAGLSPEDAYEILDQSLNDRLVVKSKKSDGTVQFVFLRKEKIENEENVVKGFLLKGERKIGYILLPAFYTQWENETGSSCANDVAKEIVKLKRENIEGLILDVRYNGGGSLGEAMDMAGIFIDEGPLMGQKQKAGKIIYLKDPNRGTIYTGPMALMVNGQSASASEILAAALQDYNRALVIGSNTFGKATMQQMMVLDTLTNKPGMITNAKDIVKITTGKLYRLNGGTAQLNGVIPDIILPDAFDGLDYREKFFPFALTFDKEEKNNYYKPLAALPVKDLALKSEERVNAEKEFQEMKKMANTIRQRRVKSETIPLNADRFEQWAKQNEQDFGFSARNSSTANIKFTVDNHNLDKAILVSSGGYNQEINNEWLNNISEDIYIQESYFVLCDMINITKSLK